VQETESGEQVEEEIAASLEFNYHLIAERRSTSRKKKFESIKAPVEANAPPKLVNSQHQEMCII
jgi:hypothetical protein